MLKPPPHFSANVRIFRREEGGPPQGFFGFSDSGVRRVPVEMDGVPNLNTVAFFYTPDTRIENGEEFEADCCVIWEEGFYPIIQPSLKFRIWDCRFIASGEVLQVYRDNWKVRPIS